MMTDAPRDAVAVPFTDDQLRAMLDDFLDDDACVEFAVQLPGGTSAVVDSRIDWRWRALRVDAGVAHAPRESCVAPDEVGGTIFTARGGLDRAIGSAPVTMRANPQTGALEITNHAPDEYWLSGLIRGSVAAEQS